MSILVNSENKFIKLTFQEFLAKYKDNEHIRDFSRDAIALIFEHIEELQEDNPPSSNFNSHDYTDVTVYFQDAHQFTYRELVMSFESEWGANAVELIEAARHIEGISEYLLNAPKKVKPEIHFSQIQNKLMQNDEYVRDVAAILAFNSGVSFRETDGGWLRLHLA